LACFPAFYFNNIQQVCNYILPCRPIGLEMFNSPIRGLLGV